MTQTQNTGRFSVTVSAGNGFKVWDKHERKAVATFKTFRAAQREAHRRNTETE